MILPITRGAESLVLEIDDKHAEREFGGIPLSMIGRINLGPFAEGVRATEPGPKTKKDRQ